MITDILTPSWTNFLIINGVGIAFSLLLMLILYTIVIKGGKTEKKSKKMIPVLLVSIITGIVVITSLLVYNVYSAWVSYDSDLLLMGAHIVAALFNLFFAFPVNDKEED